ncbi:hypothetical protein ACNEP5_27455 [Escherichia coli]
MRFPPIKLFGYDKAANSLLEKIEVFYELQCGAISPEEMSVCPCLNCSLNGLDGTENGRRAFTTAVKTICSR